MEYGAFDYLAKAQQEHLRREAAKARAVHICVQAQHRPSVLHRLLGLLFSVV